MWENELSSAERHCQSPVQSRRAGQAAAACGLPTRTRQAHPVLALTVGIRSGRRTARWCAAFASLSALLGCATATPGQSVVAVRPVAPHGRDTAALDAAASAHPVAFLDRIGWGADAAELQRLQRLGATRFLEAQLNPRANARLPEPIARALTRLPVNAPLEDWMPRLIVAQQRILRARRRTGGSDAAAQVVDAKLKALRRRMNALTRQAMAQQLLQAIYAQDQLRQRLVWFWMNHFNVFRGGNIGPGVELRLQEPGRAESLQLVQLGAIGAPSDSIQECHRMRTRRRVQRGGVPPVRHNRAHRDDGWTRCSGGTAEERAQGGERSAPTRRAPARANPNGQRKDRMGLPRAARQAAGCGGLSCSPALGGTLTVSFSGAQLVLPHPWPARHTRQDHSAPERVMPPLARHGVGG